MKEVAVMKIGERIRSIRKSQGITQADLATAIHVTPSFMNYIEQGLSLPSLEHICNIASALHVTPQDVLCDIFVYSTTDLSTSEKIKIEIEKLPCEQQSFFLRLVKGYVSQLD